MPRWLSKTWRSLATRYFVVDLRSLGAFRIAIATTLLFDLVTRISTCTEFLTNEGVFPNHYSLFNPPGRYWSIFHAFSVTWQVTLALLGLGVLELLLLFGVGGWRVRCAVTIGVISLNTRNLLVENGGHVVLNLFLVWSLFLPVDHRLTWGRLKDHGLRRELAEEGTFCSVAVLGAHLSIALIYLFNALTKTGQTWADGSAVGLALHLVDRVTPFGIWMRENLSRGTLAFLTHATWDFEWAVVFLIFSPFFTAWTRTASALGQIALHVGIGLAMVLGPFSPAMISVAFLLLPGALWRRLGRRGDARANDEPRPTGRARLVAREGLAAGLIYYTIAQSLVTYWDFMDIPHAWSAPQWTDDVRDYLRIPQNWRMFATDPPSDPSVQVPVGRPGGRFQRDLETGHPFAPDCEKGGPCADIRWIFEHARGVNYVQVEWNTRFANNDDYLAFTQRYLLNRYPDCDSVTIYEVHPTGAREVVTARRDEEADTQGVDSPSP